MRRKLPELGEVPTIGEYEVLHPHENRVSGKDQRGNMGRPDISVITVCFNAAKTIAATIESIAAQTDVPNVEYIVVDGGSTDGTIEILRSRPDVITYWISEPDRGISDAFNKGIALATAPIVTHLNADDTAGPGHLAAALKLLADHPEAGFCHGDMRIVTADGKVRREIRGTHDYRVGIERRMTVNHPTTVVRKAIYNSYGLFRRELKYAMDYDLIYRLANARIPGAYSSSLIASMRDEGVSNTQWRAATKDLQAIQIANGASPMKISMLGWGLHLRIIVRNALEIHGFTGIAATLRKLSNIGSGKPR